LMALHQSCVTAVMTVFSYRYAARNSVALAQLGCRTDNPGMSIQTDDFEAPRRARATPANPFAADAHDRVVGASVTSPLEDVMERALRPKDLDEYVGQDKAREPLEIFIG